MRGARRICRLGRALRGPFLALTLGAALVSGAQQAGAEEQRLTRPEARAYANQLLRQDQPAAAAEIARALLSVDAQDFVALMLLSRAELDQRHFKLAQRAARRAFRLSEGEQQRFAAAYGVAQALTGQEHFARAQWWLRRAGQATDDPQLEQVARNQFSRVRAANPWQVDLSLSFAPSNNVNNGSRTNWIEVLGIPFADPSAAPLDGFTLNSSLVVRRRIETPGGTRLRFGIGAQDQRVFLSAEAKASPGPFMDPLRNSDFSYSLLRALFDATWESSDRRSRTDLKLELGHHRSGEEGFMNHGRIALGRSWITEDGRSFSTQLAYERQNRTDNKTQSADVFILSGHMSRPVGNGGRLSFGLSLSQTRSDHFLVAHNRAEVNITYRPGWDILGAEPSFGLSANMRKFAQPNPIFGNLHRSDNGLRLKADLFLSQHAFYGFAPTIGLSARVNKSNIPNYETNSIGLSLGVRSTF